MDQGHAEDSRRTDIKMCVSEAECVCVCECKYVCECERESECKVEHEETTITTTPVVRAESAARSA